jgi:hypothetical protein
LPGGKISQSQPPGRLGLRSRLGHSFTGAQDIEDVGTAYHGQGSLRGSRSRGPAEKPGSAGRAFISNLPHFALMRGAKFAAPGASGTIWSAESFYGRSDWLAGRVVTWHTLNLVGFGPVNFQACHSKIQSSRQAETLSFNRSRIDLFGKGLTFALKCRYRSSQRCEMKNPSFVAELHKKLGVPSSETLESLRLLKAFVKLAPRQQSEVVELVERLGTGAQHFPDRPFSR